MPETAPVNPLKSYTPPPTRPADPDYVSKRYMLVGGNPFRSYTGTTTFTSLRVVGSANTKEEALKLVHDKGEECGFLCLWIDRETGLPGEP